MNDEALLALIATSSSPSLMKDRVMVTSLPLGSMPSVLRAVYGVEIFTPQAVNPLPFQTTWNIGELRRVILYRVKELAPPLSTRTKLFWLLETLLAAVAM